MRKNWAVAVIVGTTLALAAAVAGLAVRPQPEPAAAACVAAGQPGSGRIQTGETDFGGGDYVFRTRGDSRAVIHLPAAAVAVYKHPVNVRLEAGRYLVETDGGLFFECYNATRVGASGETVALRSAPFPRGCPVTLAEQKRSEGKK